MITEVGTHKLNINQISKCLFETALTLQKQTKINYEDQFKINEILKDEIKKKTKINYDKPKFNRPWAIMPEPNVLGSKYCV